MKTAEYWIEKLQLQAHPEGGYFRETYRSPETVSSDSLPHCFEGDRSYSTAIYYLLECDQFSAFHRLKSDELWHFYAGSPLSVYVILQAGGLVEYQLGENFETGEKFQLVIPASTWLAARCSLNDSYSLVGCTVAPGFDFNDLEFASKQDLISRHPEYAALICQLSRD